MEADSPSICMIAVPRVPEDTSKVSEFYRTVKIGVSHAYVAKLCKAFATPNTRKVARVYAFVSILHECCRMLTPHLLRLCGHDPRKLTPERVGGHYLPRPKDNLGVPESERTGDFGFAWEESMFGGVVALPDPMFSVLHIVRLKNRDGYATDIGNLRRWVLPYTNCDHILREIDSWIYPTGLARYIDCLRFAFPRDVFNNYMNVAYLPECRVQDQGAEHRASNEEDQGQGEMTPLREEEHRNPVVAQQERAGSPSQEVQRLRADPTQAPVAAGPPQFFKTDYGIYYTTMPGVRV